MAGTGVDRRLDGEGHVLFQDHAGTRAAVMQHLRVLVVHPADAVTAVFAHHREALGLDIALDRVTDVAQRCPRSRDRSEEHKSELKSLMRISYAGFCLKKKKNNKQ